MGAPLVMAEHLTPVPSLNVLLIANDSITSRNYGAQARLTDEAVIVQSEHETAWRNAGNLTRRCSCRCHSYRAWSSTQQLTLPNRAYGSHMH